MPLLTKDSKVLEALNMIWRLDRPNAQQNRNELDLLLDQHVAGVKSILEIGSCFGQTLLAMAEVAAPGALLRIIDLGILPEESSYPGFNLRPSLTKVGQELMTRGFDVSVGVGDSRDQSIVEWARQWAPYDFVFIDGGHTYECVKLDWMNYGPMGKVVAFHDIANTKLGVSRFFDELVEGKGPHDYRRIVCPMGIGVVGGGQYDEAVVADPAVPRLPKD